MTQEDRREFAGHLKAELLDARDEFVHQRLTEAEYLGRIKAIKNRAKIARSEHAYQLSLAPLLSESRAVG